MGKNDSAAEGKGKSILRGIESEHWSSLGGGNLAVGSEETEKAPDYAPDDVGKLGNLVTMRDPVPDLLPEEEDKDQDKGEGYCSLFEVAYRGQEDHHEDDAAGTQQYRRGKQEDIEHSGYHGCHKHHDEEGQGTVAGFQDGTEKEDETEIRHEVVYA